MATRSVLSIIIALLLGGLATAASAHTGSGSAAGLTAGLGHPLLGLDHLLAMFAVGLWAARLGGRGLWLVPLAFLGLAGTGAVVAFLLPGLPVVELAIVASLAVLGGLLAFEVRLANVWAMALVGFFALFHGHAHGAEAALTGAWFGYGIGFLATTALLMAAGIAIERRLAAVSLRWVGAVVALAGGALAFGL
ncbi:MAG: HupE/UreJ family protein [Alphaproteobacteria bacterium]|jgi:urease accessory protein|nr:HupE/UreJ family protein [Alphaproteobacteria bacterium]